VCFLKPREFDIFRLCASVASRVDCCLTRKRAIRRDLNAFFPTPRRTLVSTHKRRVDGRLNILFFAATFFKKTRATLREKFARLGFRNGPTNAPDARASSVKLRRAVLQRTEMFLLHHFVALAHP